MRGGEVGYLAWFIPKRSGVRVPLPLQILNFQIMLFKDDKKIGLEEAAKLCSIVRDEEGNIDEKKTAKAAADVLAVIKKRIVWRVVPTKVTTRTYENLKTEKQRNTPSAPAGTHVPMAFPVYTNEGTFILRFARNHTPATGNKEATFEPPYMQIEQKGFFTVDDPETNLIFWFNPKNKVDFERYDLSDKTSAALNRDKEANTLRSRIYEMSDENAKAALYACANSKHVTNIPDPKRATANTARVALLRIVNHPSTDLRLFATEILDTLTNDLLSAVKRGIANKTVVYDVTAKAWSWTNTGKLIVKNTTDEVPEQVLVNHFKKLKNTDTVIEELTSGLVSA